MNLFEKDFLIVPINKHAHWFLAIICYPYLSEAEFVKCECIQEEIDDPIKLEKNLAPETSKKASELKLESNEISDADEAKSGGESNQSFSDSKKETGICIKRPIILIFDSLPNNLAANKSIITILKE